MFTLRQNDQKSYTLICTATGREYPFTYQKARLCEKLSGSYKVESDWSGTAAELFDKLIPKLTLLRTLLKPAMEDFSSKFDQSEYSYNDTCYCSEFQTSKYHCTFATGPELTFIFKNAELDRVVAPALDSPVRNLIERLAQQALKTMA